MTTKFFLALVVVAAVLFHSGAALTCLHCQNIYQSRHCRTVTTCSDDEICGSERVNNNHGTNLYNIGCFPKATCKHTVTSNSICLQCCNSDLCNVNLCSQPDYPQHRGPVCYSCPVYSNASSCNDIDFCTEGNVCGVKASMEFGELVFSSSCTTKAACSQSNSLGSQIIGIGKRSIDRQEQGHTVDRREHEHTVCDVCCDTDICNQKCDSATEVVRDTIQDPNFLITLHKKDRSNLCIHGTCENHHGSYACTCSRGLNCHRAPSDCVDILANGGKRSGLYSITLKTTRETRWVYCDMTTDGGGWTVVQNRFNGSVDFYRNFSEYENGFGGVGLHHEFWFGLHNIYELSRVSRTVLRLDLESGFGTTGYQVFNDFSLSAAPGYTLHLGSSSGTLGDSRGLSYSNGHDFSTFDHDRDARKDENCAVTDHGGWWYNSCVYANLNGLYCTPGQAHPHDEFGLHYTDFYGGTCLKASKMMIRRV